MKRKTKQAATAAEAEERAIYAYDARAWLEEIQRAAASPAVTEAAGKALQALAVDDAGRAVWWALATMDHRHKAHVSRANNSPFVKREVGRQKGKARQKERTKVRVDAAIDDALKLIHGGLSKTDAQRTAAKNHKTSLTSIRRFWPTCLD